MPLTPATCSQCGASLSYDVASNILFCQHCDTAHIVETDPSDIHAEANGHLKKARQWGDLGEMSKARAEYMAATECDPSCHEAWMWLLENSIFGISHMGNDLYQNLSDVETYFHHARQTSADNRDLKNVGKKIISTLDRTKKQYDEALETCRKMRTTRYFWIGNPAKNMHFDTIQDHIRMIERKQQTFDQMFDGA